MTHVILQIAITRNNKYLSLLWEPFSRNTLKIIISTRLFFSFHPEGFMLAAVGDGSALIWKTGGWPMRRLITDQWEGCIVITDQSQTQEDGPVWPDWVTPATCTQPASTQWPTASWSPGALTEWSDSGAETERPTSWCRWAQSGLSLW